MEVRGQLVLAEPPVEQLEYRERPGDVFEDAAVLPAEDARALAIDPLPDGVDRCDEGARGDGRPVVRLGEVREGEVFTESPWNMYGGGVPCMVAVSEDMAGLELRHHVVGDHRLVYFFMRPYVLPARRRLLSAWNLAWALAMLRVQNTQIVAL